MSKTFKKCLIFFISSLWLIAMRLIFAQTSLSDNISEWLFSMLNQIIGLGIIPIVMFKFWVKEPVMSGLSIRAKINPAFYGLAVAVGLLLYSVNGGISIIWQMILRLIGYTHINSAGIIYSSPEVLVMELLTTALLPAVFEEITDRGLTLSMLENVKNDKLKIIVIALLFGLAHQNVVQTGYTFVGGLVFAFFALKTRSILPGMIIHFINNGLSVVFDYSSQTNGLLGALQDKYYNFINNNFLLVIIIWIAIASAIVSLLKVVSKLSLKAYGNEQEPIPTDTPFDVKLSSIDRIFSSSTTPSVTMDARPRWYEYAFLYASMAITIATTLFSFYWGLIR